MFAEHQEFLGFKGPKAQNIFHSYLYSESERAEVLITDNFACKFLSASIFYFTV